MAPEALVWQGCYDEGWRGFITPESFAHPAKMAHGLLVRILKHGFERGYWHGERDVVVTPEILAEIQKEIDNDLFQQL